jgi:hypothetical protein
VKEALMGQWLDLAHANNKVFIASLCHLSTNDYNDVLVNLPYQW